MRQPWGLSHPSRMRSPPRRRRPANVAPNDASSMAGCEPRDSAAFALGALVSGWQANAAGLATPMSISGALLALGGMVALLLPSLPQDRTPTGSSRTTLL